MTAELTIGQVDRNIQEREHELYETPPDENGWQHTNCRVCGPGPLKRGLIPSQHNHVFYRTEQKVLADEYGVHRWEERVECPPKEAQVVSSELDESRGCHTVMLDIDIRSRLIESSTPGHHHLYIDKVMSWRKYKRLLRAMYKAGIIEKGYYQVSVKRKATHLRPPWVEKSAG